MSQTPPEPQAPSKAELTKIAIDLAPLLVALGAYYMGGFFWATGMLMGTTVISLVASRVLLGHISATLVVTTTLVLGLGALTFWFDDPRFIKMKPTIAYLLFAAILFGGLLIGKPTLRLLLGQAFRLPDNAWSVLSVRWGAFFVGLAALNELIWRTQSDAFWFNFKFFGFFPLTLVFFVSQLGFIQRHQIKELDASDKSAH